jgi:hypothetical protein
MHQQLWGYKVEEKLYLGVHEQTRLNTTAIAHVISCHPPTAEAQIKSQVNTHGMYTLRLLTLLSFSHSTITNLTCEPHS